MFYNGLVREVSIPQHAIEVLSCRFICSYVMGYFPISLHVEDFKAFYLSRAYGEFPLNLD
jgi:hypothetical protein